MNIFEQIIAFHIDLVKSKSGISHKRYIATMSFYAIIMFGLLDLKFNVPEIVYIILSALAGVQSTLSILEKKKKQNEDP